MKQCTDCESTDLREGAQSISLDLPCRAQDGQRGERTFDASVNGVRCGECGVVAYDGPDVGNFERLVAIKLLELGISTGAEARFLRKKAGIKAADLAALLGVTPETVSHWETEKSQPSASELFSILQLARERLTERATSPKSSPAPSTSELLERIRSPRGALRLDLGDASTHAA